MWYGEPVSVPGALSSYVADSVTSQLPSHRHASLWLWRLEKFIAILRKRRCNGGGAYC